jgi:hypothetical protein
MRDDIKTAADIIAILGTLPMNVIVTPVSGPEHFGNVRGMDTTGISFEIEQNFKTALKATEKDVRDQRGREAAQTDFELLQGKSGQTARLATLTEKARNTSKFKQVTKITPLPEGEPA